MAKIDHSFTMGMPPRVAQAMFARDIAPELAHDRRFQIARERPGEIAFSDGVRVGAGPETLAEEEAVPAPAEDEPAGELESLRHGPDDGRFAAASPLGGPLPLDREGNPEDPLLGPIPGGFTEPERLLARRIHVEFTPHEAGTLVHVHGHCEHDIRRGLELLGTPGHWPETADRPHD
jgi:hypothetical protein